MVLILALGRQTDGQSDKLQGQKPMLNVPINFHENMSLSLFGFIGCEEFLKRDKIWKLWKLHCDSAHAVCVLSQLVLFKALIDH